MYKLPIIPDSSHPLVKDGVGHFYMDVGSPQWSLSDVSLNSSGHAVYNTLKQVYNSQVSVNFLHLSFSASKNLIFSMRMFGLKKNYKCLIVFYGKNK